MPSTPIEPRNQDQFGPSCSWVADFEAQQRWWEAVSSADQAALSLGALKVDLALEHLRMAASLQGWDNVWDFLEAKCGPKPE